MATANPRLQGLLKKIRTVRHKAGTAVLCDEAYRQILQRAAGVKSSKDIRTVAQADAVLDEFRRLGLIQSAVPAKAASEKPANEWGFVFRLPADRQLCAKKIYRLAEKIGALQEKPVPVMSKRWVEGTAKQMLGFNKPEYKDKVEVLLENCEPATLQKIVQALECRVRQLGGGA